MISLICFCAFKWLWYLLSGLLGLLLGWLLWGYLKKLVASLEDENRSYRSRITQLENEARNTPVAVDIDTDDLRLDLENSLKKRAELEGELAIAYGRIREMEAGTASAHSTITHISGDASSTESNQFLSVPLQVSEGNDDPVFDNAAEIIDLKNRIALLTDREHDLNAELNDLRNKLSLKSDQEHDLTAEVNDLRNAISLKTDKEHDLAAELNDLRNKIALAGGSLVGGLGIAGAASSGSTESSNSKSSSSSKSRSGHKQDPEEKIEDLEARLRTAQRQNADLLTKISAYKDGTLDSESESEKLSQDLDNEKSKVLELQEQLSALTLKYDEALSASSTNISTEDIESSETVQHLNQELEYEKTKVTDLQNQLNALNLKYEEAKTEASSHQQTADSSSENSDQVNALNQELDEQKARVRELENQMHALKYKYDEVLASTRTNITKDIKGFDSTFSSPTKIEVDSSSSDQSGEADESNVKTGHHAGASEKTGLHGNISSSSDANSGNVEIGASGIASDKFSAIDHSNLQIIEGIGPAMEKLYKENGVNSVSDLASKSDDELQAILDKYGDKYRIIDPKTWNDQAKLASEDKWEELIAYQKTLVGGKEGTSNKENDSKVEKVMVKLGLLKKWNKDDLKAIEGIGPKIAGLLINAGINTWRELSTTSVVRLQEILDAAGKRYALANPSTWPEQAKLAAEGRFAELDKLQDELNGGRR